MNLDNLEWYQKLKESIVPIFLEDFYKSSHALMYGKGISKIYANYTPRYGRDRDIGMNWFGIQYFIKEYLFYQFNEHFFKESWTAIEAKAKDFYHKTLGDAAPNLEHLKELHSYRRMPIDIYSVAEGEFLPYGVPGCVIVNTDPRFFWLPNKLETLLSCSIWGPSTSATTAAKYRSIFTRWAKEFGETDLGFVDYMGHDFSMRGMWGVEGATISGMGHLTSFAGTDTEPALWAARKYYNLEFGPSSVPATEHSVMSASGMGGEFETFERLLFDVYPTGILSIVSDTWNLWDVCTKFIPRLKDRLLQRQGKLVIRPDSGNPVQILTGNPDSSYGPERAGVLRLLEEVMGTDGHGHLNSVGTIYGDGISPERAEQIHRKTVQELHLSPYNVVLGLGSYSYTYVTRDNHGQAVKATAVVCDGKLTEIFKDPITDVASCSKKSHRGIPIVHEGELGLLCHDQGKPEDLDNCAFRKVVGDGHLLIDDSMSAIRKRIQTPNLIEVAA